MQILVMMRMENLQTLNRNAFEDVSAGITREMDGLDYEYDTDLSNRLLHVDDAYGVAHTIDIGDQDLNNFGYNEIGQLISDVSEGITEIDWNVHGKSEIYQTQ